MTAALFDKIGVAPLPDERVLWSHVQSEGTARRVLPVFNWVNPIAAAGFMMLAMYQLIAGGFSSVFAWVLLALAVQTAVSVFRKFDPKAPITLQGHNDPVFMSCVITTRRILLFDFAGEPVTLLDRAALSAATLDYVQGARGLIFRSDQHPDQYAFIANIDHQPMLRALDMNRNTP